MIPLEFRIWDKEEKCFVANKTQTDFFIGLDGDLYQYVDDNLSNLKIGMTGCYRLIRLDKNRYEISQYTGKKDRNSIKIFADDIINLSGYVTHVRWDEKNTRFFCRIPNINYGDCIPAGCLIIGNAHQNKNLLEGNQ